MGWQWYLRKFSTKSTCLKILEYLIVLLCCMSQHPCTIPSRSAIQKFGVRQITSGQIDMACCTSRTFKNCLVERPRKWDLDTLHIPCHYLFPFRGIDGRLLLHVALDFLSFISNPFIKDFALISNLMLFRGVKTLGPKQVIS